jgi:hypothetical protein
MITASPAASSRLRATARNPYAQNILRREGRKDTGILVNSSGANVAPDLLRDIELLASTALHVEVGEATA